MIVGAINTKDISFVVQGPVTRPSINLCLDSIRKYFPGAEIILSTESQDLNGLDYDVPVIINDVGNDILRNSPFKLNVKRQIYSTQKGLEKVSRKYALKVRSDIEFTGNNFLKYFDEFNKYDENYRVFNKRILVPMIQHSRYGDFLFFPTDWLHFGLAEDIKNFFNIPYNTDDNNAYVYEHPLYNQSRHDGLSEFNKNIFSCQYWSEQYIFFKCLLANGKKIDFRDWTHVTDEMRLESEKYLVNNFFILEDGKRFDIKHNKLPNYSKANIKLVMSSSYHFKEFVSLYKIYCDNQYKIPLKYKNFLDERTTKKLLQKTTQNCKALLWLPYRIVRRLLRTPYRLLRRLYKMVYRPED